MMEATTKTMVDTTEWPDYERQRWMKQEVDNLRKTNAINSRNAALANLPDNFKNTDTTRKTCIVQEIKDFFLRFKKKLGR